MTRKEVVVEGDTVDYAIRNGLKNIGLPQESVYAEVLQKDSHSFFTGVKSAVVRLTYEEEESKAALKERAAKEFRRNFKFSFSDVSAQVCLPGMFYDSRYYESDDVREVFLREFLHEKGIENPDDDAIKNLSTNPQAQSSFVTVKRFHVESINEKGDQIYLRKSKDKMLVQAIIFFDGEDTVTEDEMYTFLKERKCVSGVLRRNIQEVLKARYTGIFDIARGKHPIDDKPAELEVFFQENEHKVFEDMMESLVVDTRTVKDINIADRNQLLIRVGEVIGGCDGYNIEGAILRKKDVAPTSAISCGTNVYKSDNEKEIYAKKAGHILWNRGEYFIDIEPVYVVEENVDFTEGNIIGFVGKVIVKGDVKPKFSVVAEGDIEIHGSVEDAVVESTTGNVFIGGSIIHQNEGYVQAKGNIHGMIATNAKLRAKNIILQKEVMNSDLEAEESIEVTGAPGVIVGGVMSARKTIRANVIGSESWVPTKVHVGDVSEKKKLLRLLNQQMGKLVIELKEAKQIVKILQERTQTHKLTETQDEQFSQAQNKITVVEEELEYNRAEEGEIKKDMEAQADACLDVIKILYPHVDLYIYEGYYLPPTVENRTGFRCKEGLIVRYPLI
jgi:uncharacterized protein